MKYKTQEIKVPEKIKKIFFVGIKGVGMAPLAIIAKEGGFDIAGSDTGEEFITDLWLNKKEVKIFEGFETHAIQEFFGESAKTMCLVITTGAHKGFDNSQVIWAKEKNIPVLTQGQALSIFMDGEIFQKRFKGIAIAGSHGKTTISSLLATTLMSLDLDPSYSVGTGEVFPSAAPGHFGNGEYFIAE
jgi:UDP-N-acetylmuramate--alanine ligase